MHGKLPQIVLALTIAPSSPLTMLAATSAGLLRSRDGGASWTRLEVRGVQSAASLLFDPTNADVAYAQAGSRTLKTTDGGESWSVLVDRPRGQAPVRDGLVMDPLDPSRLYLFGEQGISRTIDGGATWTPLDVGGSPEIYPTSIAIAPGTPTTLYATLSYRGISRSDDGGDSWRPIYADPSPYIGRLQVDPRDASIILRRTDDGIWRSVDGGLSWTASNTGLAALPVDALAVDPSAPTRVFAVGVSGLWLSGDGGETWSSRSAGLEQAGIHRLAIDPHTPATLYVASNPQARTRPEGSLREQRGFFKSLDVGESWTRADSGLRSPVSAAVVDPFSADTVYVGTPGDGVYKSTDGGASWAPANSGRRREQILALVADPATPGRLYAGSDRFALTTDGGATWTRKKIGRWVQALALDPLTPTTLYAGTADGVLKSVDAGESWLPTGLAEDTEISTIAVDPKHPSTIYAGAERFTPNPATLGALWRSDDGGATWTALAIRGRSPRVGAIAVAPTEPTTLYVGLRTGGIFRSTDGGRSWD